MARPSELIKLTKIKDLLDLGLGLSAKIRVIKKPKKQSGEI